ncbi:FAD-binding oxidoreductase [Ideonella margarita]|uniref:FAD-binding oxidoreductase n=1 Tax=Ideonella margarita TaxID=2984191 RepID=A0ABU9C944_9BURK
MDGLLAHLRQLLGAAGFREDGDLSPWEKDWRGRWPGSALAVALPASTEEVAAVVRACAAAGVAIVPQGGNTGLVGGGVPDATGRQLVLSLRRMNTIRAVDVANLTLTVDAGCLLTQVQAAAEENGLLYPLSLAAEGNCTIGGNLATNAGGTQVLRYGNARELCLGLEVVTPQGEIWHGLSGLRKDNTGYDLRDLFIGSEGTLGVITAATLKLHPRPGAVMTALAGFSDLNAALRLIDRSRRALDAGLTGFELMSAHALGLVQQWCPPMRSPLPATPWTALIELAAATEAQGQRQLEELLGDALACGDITDAAVATSLSQAAQFWALREAIPRAQALSGLNIKHDIALPVSAIPAFVSETHAALQAALPGCRPVTFGHLGDGNLHYNVQAPEGVEPATFLREQEALVNALVHDRVSALGGSISAEHGIGVLKREELARRKSPVALQMMRAIKQALDPQGLMNPGRLLPD